MYPGAQLQTPDGINYALMGLLGEAGELANKWKKVLRGDRDLSTAKLELRWELGDTLWYVARLAEELGIDLNSVANANLEKLRDRKKRGTIRGVGDHR